jgi:hypothetical protein
MPGKLPQKAPVSKNKNAREMYVPGDRRGRPVHTQSRE